MTTESSSNDAEAPGSDARRTAAQECAAIEADLERLKAIVSDAAERLLGSFNEFADVVRGTKRESAERQRIEAALGKAVTALQFQDMANQLTGHAQRRLLALEACLRALGEEAGAEVILEHAQPVRQAEMSAGSVDLF